MQDHVFNQISDFLGVRSDAMRAALRLIFVDGLSQAEVLLKHPEISQQSLSRAVNSWRKSISQIVDISKGVNMIDNRALKSIRGELRVRVERTLKSMAQDFIDISLTEGRIYEDFIALVPHASWESAPNPSYSHWNIYLLDESYIGNEALSNIGRVGIEHSIHWGTVITLHPNLDLKVNAGNAYTFEKSFMSQLRTFDEQRVHDLYWEAVGVFNDVGRKNERIPKLQEFLIAMRDLSAIEK